MATRAKPRPGAAAREGMTSGLVWSLLAHGVLVALVLMGGLVIPRSPPPAELGIQAVVVDPEALPARRPDDERRAAEERARELERQRLEEERRREEETRLAETEARRQEERQQQEQKRQQEQKKETEAARQREEKARLEARQAEEKAKAAAAEKRRAEEEAKRQAEAKAKAERERAEAERKAAEEKKAAEAKRQQEAAEEERRRKAAAEMARQLAEEERRFAAVESGALSQYVALIRQRVERNWVRPGSARAGLECEVFVTQIPGGEVTGVRMGRCNGDDAVRRSIEAAVMRASPLPPPDDPSLFERNLRFVFKPEE